VCFCASQERLARFMGTEEAILYSYDLATLPSILPAFASKKDLILCDEAVNYAVQNGAHLSRAKVSAC
jgi:serine palmitoyltransferase